tara:strand:+ start:8476 stop:8955 length:480 start_codon:yes stop_codon:yes gene_type:complete
MKRFLRLISPKHAAQDFASQWRAETPYRWHILGIAMASTFAIFTLFIPKSVRIAPVPPEVVYITTLDENRTDAEIIASNCANQKLKDELEAQLEQQEEARKEAYAALGRATFIDVDEMQAEIEAEQAAARAAAEAAGEVGPSEEEIAQSVEEYCARAAS